MKTSIAIAAATAALFTFGGAEAKAGDSCRVHSSCSHCHNPIYSYYRPVRYVNNCAVYGWVPTYHSNCRPTASTGISIRYYSGPSVTRYNYGYRTSPSLRSSCTTRSLQGYRSYRSFPTVRIHSHSRFHSHCR